jgi:hypothetical protein
MIWSAATHNEEAEASPTRRRRTLRGTHTPMSNGRIDRARATALEVDENRAARAPVQSNVRQRVLQHAAAPPAAPSNPVAKHRHIL